jgi:hypothetical protein
MAGKRAPLATSFGPTSTKDLRPVRPAAAARCAEVRPPKRPVVPPRSGWSDVFLQMWSGQLPGSSGAKTQDRRQSFGTRGALGTSHDARASMVLTQVRWCLLKKGSPLLVALVLRAGALVLGAGARAALVLGCDTRSHVVSELVEEVRQMSKT